MPAFHVHVEDPGGRRILPVEAASPSEARRRAGKPGRLILKVKILRADETPRGARLTRKALLRQHFAPEPERDQP